MIKISQVGLDQDFYDELVLKKVGKTLADLGNICNFIAVFKVFQEKKARIMEERKFKNRLEEAKAGIRKTRKAELERAILKRTFLDQYDCICHDFYSNIHFYRHTDYFVRLLPQNRHYLPFHIHICFWPLPLPWTGGRHC
jgi:hypothetical protein